MKRLDLTRAREIVRAMSPERRAVVTADYVARICGIGIAEAGQILREGGR